VNDIPIGPNNCWECGRGYGEHSDTCQFRQGPPASPTPAAPVAQGEDIGAVFDYQNWEHKDLVRLARDAADDEARIRKALAEFDTDTYGETVLPAMAEAAADTIERLRQQAEADRNRAKVLEELLGDGIGWMERYYRTAPSSWGRIGNWLQDARAALTPASQVSATPPAKPASEPDDLTSLRAQLDAERRRREQVEGELARALLRDTPAASQGAGEA